MTNKVINDNKSNFEEIRKDLQALNGVQIKDYEEGKYQGEFRNGKRDGRGIFIYKTGDRYEGEFRNDKAEGRGRFLWKAGNKYEGYFVNGLRTGRGVFFFQSGNRYVGDFLNGKKEGKGTFIFADGNVYDGSWKNDKKRKVKEFSILKMEADMKAVGIMILWKEKE